MGETGEEEVRGEEGLLKGGSVEGSLCGWVIRCGSQVCSSGALGWGKSILREKETDTTEAAWRPAERQTHQDQSGREVNLRRVPSSYQRHPIPLLMPVSVSPSFWNVPAPQLHHSQRDRQPPLNMCGRRRGAMGQWGQG